MISIANQAVFAFLSIAASTLIPLLWSTLIEFGGLGLAPASIYLWMSAYGCISAISLFALFLRIVARLGPRRVVVAVVATLGVIYVLHTFENMLLARGAAAAAAIVWSLIVLQLLSLSFCDMGFSESPCFWLSTDVDDLFFLPVLLGSILMYISSSVPNKRSLGATNGLAQKVVTIQCTSLFHNSHCHGM